MFRENGIEECVLSRVRQVTGPGLMHETSARTWCSGRTWRERVGREVGGGIGMGKTCEPKAFSFQCMTKFTTNKKKKKKEKKYNNNNNNNNINKWRHYFLVLSKQQRKKLLLSVLPAPSLRSSQPTQTQTRGNDQSPSNSQSSELCSQQRKSKCEKWKYCLSTCSL